MYASTSITHEGETYAIIVPIANHEGAPFHADGNTTQIRYEITDPFTGCIYFAQTENDALMLGNLLAYAAIGLSHTN